ncbi:MAG: ATP-binding protein [Candidatus Hydrogenedentes bacterium]|nr:ATP-binding protein [Candidatus Hydrogenedentota bacterium]
MRVVLVVAEEAGVREALAASLKDSGVVFIESSVDDALRRLITAPADVILIDDTPRLGVDALARIRAKAPLIPIVALLGRGDSETRASYIAAGAQGCVTKPFSCDNLTAAVETASLQCALSPATVAPANPASTDHLSLDRHQTALRWLGRLTANLDNPARLPDHLIEAMKDVFGAARCAVLLEERGAIRVAAAQGVPRTVTDSLRLDFSAGLMRLLEESPVQIDRSHIVDAAAQKELQLLGARFAAPLMCDGVVSGALLVGDVPSGRDYSQDDRELLALLARTAGIALENSRRYRSMADQQGQLETIFTHLSSGMVVVAPDKSVTFMNESAETLLQVRKRDIVGRSVQRLGSAFADVALRALGEGRALFRQEIRDIGANTLLGVSAAPVGEHGVALIFARLPVKESGKAPSEDVLGSPYWEFLSARVAQEVKNPLVAINTFAQLLPRKYDSTEFRTQFSDVVQKEVARINRVVETLYDFARPPRLSLQRASVNDAVTNVLGTFEEKFRDVNIQLNVDFDMSNPNAELDSLYFAQALHNVFQNACEMMPGGGKLKVDTRAQGDMCEITVADTGPGIDAGVAPLVFLPFFSTRETGMGLGLSVAHRIMRQHHGDLKLVSSQAGSTFVFFMPLRGTVSALAGAPRAVEQATTGATHEDRPGR